MAIPTSKLLALAVLCCCALLLAAGALTLQILVLAERERLGMPSDGYDTLLFGKVQIMAGYVSPVGSGVRLQGKGGASAPRQMMSEQNLRDRYLHARPKLPPDGASHAVSAEAYWNQAAAFLRSWDAALKSDDSNNQVALTARDFLNRTVAGTGAPAGAASSTASEPSLLASPLLSLERAAHAGHATAQLYLANAYASGIWPTRDDGHPRKLHVPDEFVDDKQDHDDKRRKRQLAMAFLHWQMAAISGNSEAMTALAYRHDNYPFVTPPAENNKCPPSVAYYEAAAHAIMDDLERDPESRAKVRPPTDKHHLATFYMRGGTASQLDWNNQPDEQDDALQFYHLKATAMAAIAQGEFASDESMRAAYTLGEIYRRGQRGVPQNVTLAHYYFDLCASHHHWKAAGHAGMIRLWQMGEFAEKYTVTENRLAALEYFEIGAPAGLEGCRRRYENTLRQSRHVQKKKRKVKGETKKQHDKLSKTKAEMKKRKGILGRKAVASEQPEDGEDAEDSPGDGAVEDNEEGGAEVQTKEVATDEIIEEEDDDDDDDDEDSAEEQALYVCDANALNGLGLIELLGIPGELDPDPERAEKFFMLAKEMGNVDAHYNLAMMWLGWKTHYRHLSDLGSDGVSDLSKSETGFGGTETGKDGDSTNFALHVSRKPGTTVYRGPTQSDINQAIRLLNAAMSKGHLQARHRLGMIYASGVMFQGSALPYHAIKQDCQRAKTHFQHIAELASPHLARRLRAGYKNYMNGNLEASLRNYLFAAETGSSLAQANAAFLMERGTCLGLSDDDCAKASVRLWKAAAERDDHEACLRLGDYYYNGRLRPGSAAFAKRASEIGPFGWMRHVIFPDEFLSLRLLPWLREALVSVFGVTTGASDRDSQFTTDESMPSNADPDAFDGERQHSDFATAAYYYRLAVDKHDSPRANYNLGFLHEWGLGLKQDFPLAKRHYDLASEKADAMITAQLALWAMSVHEKLVLLGRAWDRAWSSPKQDGASDVGITDAASALDRGKKTRKTLIDVFWSQCLNWETHLLAVLVVLLLQVIRYRNNLQMRQRQR